MISVFLQKYIAYKIYKLFFKILCMRRLPLEDSLESLLTKTTQTKEDFTRLYS